MKKLILIFGGAGCGKHTLINSIKEENEDVMHLLDIANYSYGVIEELDLDKKHNIISQFMNMEMDILIALGFYQDIEGNDTFLRRINRDFPNLEKEIIFLNVLDSELLFERFMKTPSIQADYDNNCKKFSKEMVQSITNQMKQRLLAYESEGYKVIEIDTTNGYRVIN